MFLLILAIILASIIGFSAHRASLCTVSAVEEIITTRRAYMLGSFLKAALWVIGVTLILTQIFSKMPAHVDGWDLTPYTIVGGLVFGAGAALNGGCAVSTLTHLGSGNLGKLLTLAGFLLGAMSFGYIKTTGWISSPQPVEALLVQNSSWKNWMLGAVALWMVWEVVRILRVQLKTHKMGNLIAPRYKLSSAAFLIGICNGVLFFAYGIWLHTRLLGDTARFLVLDAPQPDVFLWVLFGSLVLGITLSALQSQRFAFKWRPQKQWIAYFFGGIFMGSGAALIPGGNDVILLSALPSLSLHAVPALISILVGVAAALYALRLIGSEIEHVDCQGDLCKSD